MNRNQQIALVAAFLLISAMFIFPPWRVIYDIPGKRGTKIGDDYYDTVPKGRVEHSGGYRFLFGQHDSAISSPIVVGEGNETTLTLAYVTTRMDYYRLAAQIIVVTLLTGLAYLILRTKDVP